LSANNLVSCATCHQPDKAFSDGLALSDRGVSKQSLLRHVPQLTNVAWYEGYFWDGGAKNLESLVFGPLTHPDEMGQDLREVVKELGDDPAYPQLFRQAFGRDTIHTAFVARALAQYMRTFISANSRYDHYIRDEGEVLTPFELEGMRLVKEKCAACHAFKPGQADFFTDFAYHNNGLDAQYPEGEEGLFKGRFRVSLDSAQMGAYKTPTLRNLPQSAPYMHDGRMPTLKAVLDHYASGVQMSPYVDTLLIDEAGRPGIPMTAREKEAILAFLHTLADTTTLRSAYR
jgi:cytochrome c peroxidase